MFINRILVLYINSAVGFLGSEIILIMYTTYTNSSLIFSYVRSLEKFM